MDLRPYVKLRVNYANADHPLRMVITRAHPSKFKKNRNTDINLFFLQENQQYLLDQQVTYL